jgi:REP element-mobilizing transposase RayT
MPAHKHLARLRVVWERQPVYFITACTAARRKLLATDQAHEILRAEWSGLRERYNWAVGPYVVMPDHVHFFITAAGDAADLSATIGKWKEWTAKRLRAASAISAPLWQPEFFDHLLRSDESRAEKWLYVRENPVRAGLVARAEDWPYAGWIHFE